MATAEEKELYNHYENLKKANVDYHKAVDKIMRESSDWISDIEQRATVKARIGALGKDIFALMTSLDAYIKMYYPPPK